VAILARQDNRSAWRTNAVCAETVIESYAFFGKSIYVRCLINLTAVSADSVRRMVIAHDENDVGPPEWLCLGYDCWHQN
jgi:hypothetical protein